ncbi:MAG: hypothetical protein WA188_13885 [Terriglobales bacterium]
MPVSAQAVSSAEVHRVEGPPFAAGMVAIMVGLKLAIHLVSSVHRYGYFRDELYFLDCAKQPLNEIWPRWKLWN